MSLGYGVSDIIALIRLANTTRERFAGSPEQFRTLQNEVSSISSLLRNIESVLCQQELTEWQTATLVPILTEFHNALIALGKIVDENSSLHSPITHGLSEKTRRVWKRLTWDPKDVQQLHSRLSLCLGLLNAFDGSLNSQLTLATKSTVELLDKRQSDREQREENKSILERLSKMDYTAQQSDFIRRRQPGTGEWLLKSNEFQDWIDRLTQTLFCPGIPGAGKTIMAATVVDELYTRFQDDSSTCIAYLYCSFRRQDQPEDLLLGLLKQLVQYQPAIPDQVKKLHDRFKNNPRQPSLDEISRVLRIVIPMYSRVFIVIDALDELRAIPERQTFLSQILELEAKTDASLFVTSRFIPEISRMFEKRTRVEIRASNEDVSKYLDGSMSQLPSFVQSNPDLQQDIKTAIIKAVDGMFMLAQLHLNSLIGKISPKALKQALKKLPTGSEAYDEAYTDAMERIKTQCPEMKSLAEKVIMWLTYSKWALTTRGLQHALAIEDGEAKLDEENITSIDNLVSVCAGLVTVDESRWHVRLVHYTAQQYFERTKTRWFPNADEDIATACITYLSFENLRTPPEDTAALNLRMQSNALYDYAARYWGDHARNAPRNSSKFDRLVMDFLENKVGVEVLAQVQWRDHRPTSKGTITAEGERAWQRCSVHSTELHLAAYFGLEKALNTLLQHTNSPDPRDYFNNTPFMLAAARGHKGVVDLLLKTGGVDADAKDELGRTALWQAARRGKLSVVKLLLETANVDPNRRDEDGRTPLFQAARKGNDDVVRLLLSSDKVDPNSEDCYGSTPLSIAARNGQEQAVKLLLMKEGIQFDSMDKFGRTSIFWAAIKGHSKIVKLLLQKYDDARVFICADDLPKVVGRSFSTESHTGCDICATPIADTESRYHCEICQFGNFDICQQCHSLGASCLNKSHKLIEGNMEGILNPAGQGSVSKGHVD